MIHKGENLNSCVSVARIQKTLEYLRQSPSAWEGQKQKLGSPAWSFWLPTCSFFKVRQYFFFFWLKTGLQILPKATILSKYSNIPAGAPETLLLDSQHTIHFVRFYYRLQQ
jgi:hypothetical protein